MVIERTDNEVIVRVPSYVNVESMQRIIDLMSYKEAVARSEAKQEDIDLLAKKVNKGWWSANRSRFIP